MANYAENLMKGRKGLKQREEKMHKAARESKKKWLAEKGFPNPGRKVTITMKIRTRNDIIRALSDAGWRTNQEIMKVFRISGEEMDGMFR